MWRGARDFEGDLKTSFQLRFPDKLKTAKQLKGISGLNGEILALGSGAEALEEGCIAVVVVEGIGMEEVGGGHRRGGAPSRRRLRFALG